MRVSPALAAALLALQGCTGAAHDDRARDQGGDAPLASPPVVTQRTTRGELALSNLDAHIAAVEAAFAEGRAAASNGVLLIELYGARTRFTGSFGDFAKMERVSIRLVAEYETAEAYAARAAFFTSVHRFDAAAGDIETAARLGLADAETLRLGLEVATDGELELAVMELAARARELPSFRTLSALATAEAALGDFGAADAHYLEAAAAYRDVSPLPLAWLAFARGVMWAEQANRPDFAEPLYREAVERIPSFVAANVHLAELEARAGEATGAVERLLRVARSTVDPEPAALIAELLLHSDPGAGAEHALRARLGYEALLAEHPLAFADHAAEFFSGPVGADAGRGLALALDNLRNRPTPRAYIVALRAARAAGDRALACELARAAEPLRSRSENLGAALDELRCG